MERHQIVIVGAGFAGAILARILQRLGRSVLLLERGSHPRFALGESSTPLAAIALERIARRYGLDDLNDLAAYGRWMERLPQLRRGLKRGFTFYHHRPGSAFTNSAANESRLLVAASPDDAVADCHWLREDVDHYLVQRAVAEGVDYRDRVELDRAELVPEGLILGGRHQGRDLRLQAELVVDASGPAGFLAQCLAIPSALERVATHSSLVFGHFEGVRPFTDSALGPGTELPAGPYPDERAAVHHILDGGWMYALPFDHGVVSAGFVMGGTVPTGSAGNAVTASTPEQAWSALLARYPSLQRQYGAARPLRPLGSRRRLQHRWRDAAGSGWVMLPHTYAFFDPLFSTGIAWSLLGVERLAGMLEEHAAVEPSLAEYQRLLAAEASLLDRLVHGAYLAMTNFRTLVAYTFLYFAAASYCETLQRLRPEQQGGPRWPWRDFLGATDPRMIALVAEAVRRVAAIGKDKGGGDGSEAGDFEAWIAEAITPYNVAGLARAERPNLYGVDLDRLPEHAGLLGLSVAAVREALPRLRGGSK